MGGELYSEQGKEIINMKGITRNYSGAGLTVEALRSIDLQVSQGEFIGIIGPSASGKSTLLNIIGCLDSPSSGDYILNGTEVNKISRNEKAFIRNKVFGFVFQSFYLLPQINISENVALPLKYGKVPQYSRKGRVEQALKAAAIDGLGDRYPDQLSGGQQQRAAIARALVNNPEIILADEPTGNLDRATGQNIMAELARLNEETGKTIIVITHDPRIAGYAKRLIRLEDGRIIEDMNMEQMKPDGRFKAFMKIEEEDCHEDIL